MPKFRFLLWIAEREGKNWQTSCRNFEGMGFEVSGDLEFRRAPHICAVLADVGSRNAGNTLRTRTAEGKPSVAKPVSPSQIDEAILSVTPDRWAKVAFVIAMVDKTFREDLQEVVELDSIAKRIEALIEDGHLAAQGNAKNWRYSEVRKLDRPAAHQARILA
jgi:hypothetical protein